MLVISQLCIDSTPVVILLLAGLHQEADGPEHAQAVPLDVLVSLEVAEVLVLDVHGVSLKQPEK